MENKSLFGNIGESLRKVMDWAENNGTQQADDYSDIFGNPPDKIEKDYKEIFGEPNVEGTREVPMEILTFKNITDFYFIVTERVKDVRKSVLHLVSSEMVGGRLLYCIDQYFKDEKKQVIYLEGKKKPLGRTVYTRTLDKHLEKEFKQSNPFEL